MPMTDARIESFMADVLALEGENPEAIREGVHIALADCGEIYRAQETNRRMKDKAAHAFQRPLPRSDPRGNATAKGNGDRRTLEVRSERYRWATLR